jgi:hypothetical protein
MSHVRQTVREGAATLLNNGTHNKWTRAYETRIPTQRQQQWDFLMVYTSAEVSTAQLVHAANIYSRDLTLNVIGMLRLPGSGDTQTIEDKMDAMAVDIETRLTFSALKAIVPKLETLYLESTNMDVIVTEEGAVDHAELTMSWRATYANAEGAPETFI